MSDVAALAVFASVLGAALGLAEGLRRLGVASGWTRRMVHLVIGLCVVWAAGVLSGPLPLYLLGAAFVVLNGSRWFQRALPSLHAIERPSQGTMVFPLALVLALVGCWTLEAGRVFALQVAFLVLAVSDPLASLVGERFGGRTRFRAGGDEKSAAGTLAFFTSAYALALGALWVLRPFAGYSLAQYALVALVVAAAAAAAELLGRGGWDNLTVVVAVATPLVLLAGAPDSLGRLAEGLAWAAGFGVVSHRLRFLDLGGAVAASLLGLSVLGLGGWDWALPGLVFFALSSVLSKVGNKRKRQAVQAEKGSRRDAGQVYANGALAWALLLVHVYWPQPWLYWAFVGAFAGAAADTWATEIGTYFRAPTLSIITWRPVKPGMSGGVSLPGTLGALAGAATVFAPIPLVRPERLDDLGLWTGFAIVVLSGLLASLADSALGGSVQALYEDRDTHDLTEKRAGNQLVRGLPWVDNDAVNLACTGAGAALLGALSVLL